MDNLVIVEAKAVETLTKTHAAQLYTYLKLMRRPVGLLINFDERLLKHGLKRVYCPL